jgi:uncharacterized cupredoxin-like copper-binding protein
MTGYYVLAIVSVAWALLLAAVGLTRRSFPPTVGLSRVMMGFAAVLAAATVGVLVTSTSKEHPREEAAEAAETAEQPGGGGETKASKVAVLEDEFTIDVSGIEKGNQLGQGDYAFQVTNQGSVEHDLAVEGGGAEKKTPLLGADERATLDVSLNPGKYRFYCTVPGHAQAGMDVQVTVK